MFHGPQVTQYDDADAFPYYCQETEGQEKILRGARVLFLRDKTVLLRSIQGKQHQET